MGRSNFTIRRNIFLEWGIIESVAFKSLTATSMRILIKFLQKRTWSKTGKGRSQKCIYTNTGIVFTHEEATAYGIKRTAFIDAIRKLVEFGFLDIEHQGGAYGKDFSRYALSDRWRDFGTANFKKVEKKRSLLPGMDVRSIMARKQLLPRKSVAMSPRKSV